MNRTETARFDDRTGDPAYQAYQILRAGFTVAPIIAGVDKFLDLLVDWDQYLAPVFSDLLPLSPHGFLMGVGGVEILAGLLVAVKPRIGGVVVALWLLGIIVNLILLDDYYDVALRDFGLALGALALARLGAAFDR